MVADPVRKADHPRTFLSWGLSSWIDQMEVKPKYRVCLCRNKYKSVQELRSTFGHLKFIQITQSFVQGLGLVWISQILVLFFQISFGKFWTDKTRVWFGLVRLNWNCLSLVWCDQVQFGLVWPNLLRLSLKSGIFEWRPWTLKKTKKTNTQSGI